MFIAFDGIDAAGKTTQIELLEKALEERNIRCQVFHIGRLPVFKDIIKGLDKKRDKFDPVLRECLYYFEALFLRHEVLDKIKQNEIFIADRYSLTFAACGRINGLEKGQVSYLTKHLVKPDIHFFIDIHPEIALRRITAYREIHLPEMGYANVYNTDVQKEKDKYSLFLGTQSKIRAYFNESLVPEQIKLDGTRSVDALHSIILNEVLKRFDNSMIDK